MNSDDVVGYSPCIVCGTDTAHLAEEGEHALCPECDENRKKAAAQFKLKMQEMRRTRSIPRYNGPRATNS